MYFSEKESTNVFKKSQLTIINYQNIITKWLLAATTTND
jgi:hypothetical protein